MQKQEMSLQIRLGVPKNQRRRVAQIFYETFQDKLKRIFGNKQKFESLIASSLRDDRILVAIIDEVVVGFAGLHYHKKTYSDPSFSQIVKIFGLTTIRALLFLIVSSFNKPKPHQLHLDTLAVSTEEQGKGIGTRLLQSTIDLARTQNISQIKLEVIQTNQKAKKLYEKIGFKTAKVTNIPYPFSYLIGFRSFDEMHYNLQKTYEYPWS